MHNCEVFKWPGSHWAKEPIPLLMDTSSMVYKCLKHYSNSSWFNTRRRMYSTFNGDMTLVLHPNLQCHQEQDNEQPILKVNNMWQHATMFDVMITDNYINIIRHKKNLVRYQATNVCQWESNSDQIHKLLWINKILRLVCSQKMSPVHCNITFRNKTR